MTRSLAALAALLSLPATPGTAPAAAPACAADASVEPAEALVGEQVLYRIRILSHPAVSDVEWAEPPLFPGLRAEWLPGDPSAGTERRFGADYRVREERRALFAERAGTTLVRAPDLLCTTPAGRERAAVPPVSLAAVTAPPGAPPSFAGLTGPVEARVSASPRAVRLGDTVRVAVALRGSGNLWRAPEPFPDDAAFGAADVFRRPVEPVAEPGVRLWLRRHFAYDVVPRAEGALRVPALRIPYLDPETRTYAWAETEPLSIPVGKRAGAAPASAPDAEARAAGPPRAPGTGEAPSALGRAAGMLALVALVLAAAALPALRRRARRASAAAAALAEARGARERGDADAEAAALSRALRAALAPHVDGAARLAPDEIAARAERAPVLAAARLLEAAERARFDPGAPPVDAVAVERALGAL